MAVYQAQFVVVSKRIVDALLAAIMARPAAALAVTPKLHLSADAAYNPTPLSVAATLAVEEANWSGYTAGGDVVVPSAPVNLNTTVQGLLIGLLYVRTLGTPDVGQTVYGWWLDDAGGFIAGERFQGGGIPMQNVGDWLDVQAAVPLGLQGVAA